MDIKKPFAWIHLNYSMYCLFPRGTNSLCQTECEVGFFFIFMASYSHYSILESVTTIYNNILKSFVLPCINDKSVFRLSLLIRPFSSVTKFIAEHDRVPHALRDDGEKCNVMQ